MVAIAIKFYAFAKKFVQYRASIVKSSVNITNRSEQYHQLKTLVNPAKKVVNMMYTVDIGIDEVVMIYC